MPAFKEGDSASFAKTITEADIVLYAGVSGDTNPLHIDTEYARTTRFGQHVATCIMHIDKQGEDVVRFIDVAGERRLPRRGHIAGPTVIDQLTHALSLRGHAALTAGYRQLLADRHVRRAVLNPTPGQYRRFVTATRDGCVYARETYGPGAAPSALHYGSTLTLRDGSSKSQFIFYTGARDSIVLSYHRVAARCVLFDQPHTMMVSPHLPDLYIMPADLTFLDAVEECYHRYQIQELGLPPDTYPDGPFLLEDDIGPLWRRAIADRGMRVLPVASAP